MYYIMFIPFESFAESIEFEPLLKLDDFLDFLPVSLSLDDLLLNNRFHIVHWF